MIPTPKHSFGLLAGAVIALAASQALAQSPPAKAKLTLDAARHVLAAAVAEARKGQAGGAIAIVDDGGHLVLLERLDGTFPMAAQISQGKARTAALFQRPTRFFEEVINKGRTAMSALPDFTPLQGGVPLVFAGQVIGAIGVSGAASAQADEDIAQAAAKSVASAFGAGPPESAKPAPASFIDGAQVAAAFAKGEPLVEVAAYKIHASRRDKPGVAELHTRDTDIIYVLDGSAALVTGGTLVDGKASAADEVRGAAIEGGETRRLRKGDVVVVPHGTPHWFKEVPGPLTYYVVKVTAAEACHAGCGAGGAQ